MQTYSDKFGCVTQFSDFVGRFANFTNLTHTRQPPYSDVEMKQ